MKSGFFIMQLWQTGNVGSHNIKKLKDQPKKGYLTKDAAVLAMFERKSKGDWEIKEGGYDFTIMELYW
jgi:hypothetical protein